jgi:hypothetical protein
MSSSCGVAITDVPGIRDSVEVSADTLFRRSRTRLAALPEDWIDMMGGFEAHRRVARTVAPTLSRMSSFGSVWQTAGRLTDAVADRSGTEYSRCGSCGVMEGSDVAGSGMVQIEECILKYT